MLLRQMLRVLMRWFPDRKFICSGDGNYATHELAGLASRHAKRLTYVSHFYPDANLYEPAPQPKPGKKPLGRPRQKGAALPRPEEVVRRTKKRERLKVAWYGGGRREVEVVTGVGQWYKAGCGLAEVRWVFVHDCTGTHRDEYFFTTDVRMSPAELIGTYTGRWNIETTFQEMRSYVGLETTRGWCEKTVKRAEPCLFGLYTVVALLYVDMPKRHRRARGVEWVGKKDVTFSDAMTGVRRWLWEEWVFARSGHGEAFAKLDGSFREMLLNGLAPAG